MKLIVCCSLIVILISACGVPDQPSVKDSPSEIIKLSSKDLLNQEVIAQFILQNNLNVNGANELYLKGIEAYVNKKDKDSAVFYFRSSIYQAPTAKAYYEWANVLKDKESYDDALIAYNLAEQLGYEPYASILYKMCAIKSLTKKYSEAADYLTYAVQAGFNNFDKIDKDPDLTNLRESDYFEDALRKGLRGVGDPKTLMWLQYKKQFPALEKNYTTKVEFTNEELNSLKFISFDFERFVSEMRDEKFSRETSLGFYYVGQVYETDNYVALLYIEKDEFGMDWYPVKYRLATFSTDGKLIDKKTLGGKTGETLMIDRAKFLLGEKIEVDELQLVMEKDIDEYGFDDNAIKETKKVGQHFFEITSEGKIVSLENTELSAAN
ncbi:MAG: hypothetical protein V4638_10690 [Bacteroidota bacterium]